MARRKASQPPKQLASLTVQQKKDAITLLQRRIDELKKFEPNSINKLNDPRINALSQAIDEALVRIFGPETIDYDRYQWASHIRSGGLFMDGYGPSIIEVREEVKEGIEKAALTFEGIIVR